MGRQPIGLESLSRCLVGRYTESCDTPKTSRGVYFEPAYYLPSNKTTEQQCT